MRGNDWKDKNYSFFQNGKCEYFPCHEGVDERDFNCLFCYCPLYMLGDRCGGNLRYTKKGVKDCSGCTVPHRRGNYGYMIERFGEMIAKSGKKPVVRFTKLKPEASAPTYGSAGAAGADLYACIDGDIIVGPHETVMIPTGIAAAIPEGYAGYVFARSGAASKRGLAPANKVGVIDSDYRGEIIVALHNHSGESAAVSPGERVAQLVVSPVLAPLFCETDELGDTERGSGGFGSTGSK